MKSTASACVESLTQSEVAHSLLVMELSLRQQARVTWSLTFNSSAIWGVSEVLSFLSGTLNACSCSFTIHAHSRCKSITHFLHHNVTTYHSMSIHSITQASITLLLELISDRFWLLSTTIYLLARIAHFVFEIITLQSFSLFLSNENDMNISASTWFLAWRKGSMRLWVLTKHNKNFMRRSTTHQLSCLPWWLFFSNWCACYRHEVSVVLAESFCHWVLIVTIF